MVMQGVLRIQSCTHDATPPLPTPLCLSHLTVLVTKLKAAGEPVLGVSECLSHITEYLYAETVGLEFLLDTPFITYTTLESTSILLSTDKKVPKVYSLQSATNQVEPVEDREDHFQLNSNPSR